jgi:hypothetical protein
MNAAVVQTDFREVGKRNQRQRLQTLARGLDLAGSEWQIDRLLLRDSK